MTNNYTIFGAFAICLPSSECGRQLQTRKFNGNVGGRWSETKIWSKKNGTYCNQ